MTITTTPAKILAAGPCGRAPRQSFGRGYGTGAAEYTGWLKGVKGLQTKYERIYGMEEPLSFADIVDTNGIDDAIWCCRTRPDLNSTWRMFEAWCITQQVEFLVPELRPAYTVLLAHVAGHHEDLREAHKGAHHVLDGLRSARRIREDSQTLEEQATWAGTVASENEFSAVEIATALVHALKPEGYAPWRAAYHAAEASQHMARTRKAQAAKFLEIVK